MQQERLRAWGKWPAGLRTISTTRYRRLPLYRVSPRTGAGALSDRARNHGRPSRQSRTWPTVARMREFYRQREPQLVMAPVALNGLFQQVLDLTQVRWNNMEQSGGGTVRVQTS